MRKMETNKRVNKSNKYIYIYIYIYIYFFFFKWRLEEFGVTKGGGGQSKPIEPCQLWRSHADGPYAFLMLRNKETIIFFWKYDLKTGHRSPFCQWLIIFQMASWVNFHPMFKEKVASHFKNSENRGGGDNPHLILWVQFNSNMKSLLLTMVSFCSCTEATVIGTVQLCVCSSEREGKLPSCVV